MRNFIYAIFLLVLLAACSQRHDQRLDHINSLSGVSPQEALDSLKAIDRSALSAADRRFYDLLTVKTNDKAYVRHTSDSLILDVIDYYSHSKDKALYTEALYYGGRVYSDLGDYPTALDYFHRSLEQLPNELKGTNIESRILSQTGRLLNFLRLYDEAIPYVKRAVVVDSLIKDSLNFVYDLQLLGFFYLRTKEYDLAKLTIEKTYPFLPKVSQKVRNITKSYLAEIFLELGKIDSALIIMKEISYTSDYDLNHFLIRRAKIFLESNQYDSAYLVASKIIHSDTQSEKDQAYSILLSDKLRDMVPPDSLLSYVTKYGNIIRKKYDANAADLSVAQMAMYNYQLHLREREKAEASKIRIQFLLLCSLFIIFIIIYLYQYYLIKQKKRIIELKNIIEKYNHYENQNFESSNMKNVSRNEILNADRKNTLGLQHRNNGNGIKKDISLNQLYAGITTINEEKDIETVSSLQTKLRTLIMDYCKKNPAITVSEGIINSKVYYELQQYIVHSKKISENDGIWKELKSIIELNYPVFHKTINTLTQGKLTKIEYRTLLLIKCGLRTIDISIIEGRSFSAIGSRRESLILKMFGIKLTPKEFDNIIRYI